MNSKIKEYNNYYNKLMNIHEHNQNKYLDIMKIDNLIENYISPSKFFNVLLDDPLIDVLNKYGTELGFIKNPPSLEETTLKNLGLQFESKIIELIKNMNIPMIEIVGHTFGDKFIKTFQAMENGIPIIYQGALIDHYHETKGYADIIIRSDYLNLFKPNIISPLESKHSSRFSSHWHYRIIDIKFTTLKQTCDQIHLQNSGIMKFYKIQLLAYNYALYQIQNYFPETSYLLGRGAKSFNQSQINNCFESISQINFSLHDIHTIGLFIKSLRWLKFIQNSIITNFDFINWNTELMNYIRPNMNNTYDSIWKNAKIQIANYIGEHTLLWSVSVEQRKKAILNGQLTWWSYKPDDNHDNLRNKTIRQIIKVNRDPNCVILPHKLPHEHFKYLPESNTVFMTIDFEVSNNLIDNFNTLPLSSNNEFIFLIGISVYDPSGELTHNKQFVINQLNMESELLMMTNFLDWYNVIRNHFGFYPIVYHWSNAENGFLERFYQRHSQNLNSHYHNLFSELDNQLFDLLSIFKKTPITIKGAFGFGLKEISKALFELGLINSTWDNNNINGLSSIFIIDKINQQAIANGNILINYPEMEQILYYNQIDCQVLVDILKFLENRYKKIL